MVIAIYTFIIHNFIVILRVIELILINRMYHQYSSIYILLPLFIVLNICQTSFYGLLNSPLVLQYYKSQHYKQINTKRKDTTADYESLPV